MNELKLYSLKEVAELLGIRTETVSNYIKAGKLNAFKVGKFWRIRETDLKAFFDAGSPVVNANRRKENQGKE